MKYSNETRTRCKSLSWVEIEREKSRIHIQQLYLQRRNNLMTSHDDISALQVSIQEQKIKEINPTKKKKLTHNYIFEFQKLSAIFSKSSVLFMRNKVSNIQHIPPRNHDSILQKLQDSKVWQTGRLLTNSLGWGHRCGLTWHNWYPYCWWTKSCTTKEDDYPIIYRVSTVPDGAGFLPSTVFPLLLVDGLNSSIETEKKAV